MAEQRPADIVHLVVDGVSATFRVTAMHGRERLHAPGRFDALTGTPSLALARRYAHTAEGPYHFYFKQLIRKLVGGGRSNLFKLDQSEPDESITADTIATGAELLRPGWLEVADGRVATKWDSVRRGECRG